MANPTITITSTTTGVSNGSTSNDTSIELTFTTSEDTITFDENDITVTGGSISNFEAASGGLGPIQSLYTATLTPSGSGQRIQPTTVDVAQDSFTDAAGNGNVAATQFRWTFENIPPTMTITSTTSGVPNGSTTNDASIELTFTSSESTINFVAGDITVSGGTLSNFGAASGMGGPSTTVYTATLTPSGSGQRTQATTVDVGQGVFTDALGNGNIAATQFKWTFNNKSNAVTVSKQADGIFSGSPFNNALLSSVGASPAKDSTSNGSSGFSRMRLSFARTYTTAVNPKKGIQGNKDASEVTRMRAVNSNSRTLNASNSDMRFTGGNDANVVRNALQRTRRGGGVPNKVAKLGPFPSNKIGKPGALP